MYFNKLTTWSQAEIIYEQGCNPNACCLLLSTLSYYN